MPHDARALANRILANWDATKFDLTNKKINKLVYFAHGFCLVRLRAGLVINHIEAWEHGPVVRVLYDSFKKFGYRPIRSPAVYFDYAVGADVIATTKLEAAEQKLFDRVVAHFIRHSGDELEQMTHEAGSPWHSIRTSSGATLRGRIPDSMILGYFADTYGGADALA